MQPSPTDVASLSPARHPRTRGQIRNPLLIKVKFPFSVIMILVAQILLFVSHPFSVFHKMCLAWSMLTDIPTTC